MAKLTERYVRDNALNHLKSYYEAQNPNTPIFNRTELETIYRNKRGRADGLLAFRKDDERIYTVSLEAKSHKTYSSLKNVALDNRLLAKLCLNFIVIAAFTWYILGSISWWLKIVITLVVSSGASFGIAALFYKQNHFDTNGIIEQVKRYPADEKWIAISIDALNGCNKYDSEMLVYKAQSTGIGILVVSAGNKVDVKLKAKKPKRTNPKSHIYNYRIHKSIVHYLDNA
mgnify:CR=1 FL=1